jgi:hypothetical protein
MQICASVTEFFHDEVKTALEATHVAATEPTEFYLVNLLAEFAKAPVANDEPLALKLAAARQQLPDERYRTLKEVGDTSLYMSGFFAEALNRKLVDVEYVMSMGGTAYGELAGFLGRGQANVFRDVYQELAAKFARFVDVLHEIRARSSFAASGNLIRLYEQWLETRSEQLQKRLRSAGLLVGGGDDPS